ncbi:MAG: proline dehydrogenase family protein [Candidatus Aenigmatarchaeota archaeon]
MGISSKFVKKWIAGETIEDAIQAGKEANERGVFALLDIVGEHRLRASKMYEAEIDYIQLLRLIESNKLKAGISLKLTQLGLDADPIACYEYIGNIAKQASKRKIFVWIDMEDAKYTEDTIKIYSALYKKFKSIGLCVQANLKRSEEDLINLLKQKANIRLVKGAYKETEEIAYQGYGDIQDQFSKLMKILFQKGDNFAIATHDKKLVEEAIKLQKKWKRKIEFQFLKGVRGKMKWDLVGDGYKVAEYIPFGENWYPYFKRRLMERKRNALLIARSVLDQG